MTEMVKRTTLYDNGRTVIRHVVNPNRAKDTLVVTFAEMMRNDPSKPGFGQEFLLRHAVDVVTVQKRHESWYQDLKVDHFRKAIAKVRASYDRVVCYGISMGAFASLYFGGSIGASIMAISPLCSIHPLYPELGHNEYRKKVEATQCDLSEAPKSDRPVCIVYDPLQPFDSIYIRSEVKPAFPNASFYIAPGSGHPSSFCLNNMRILGKLVLGFVDNDATFNIAAAMRPLRATSHVYLETMADRCSKKMRFNTAVHLYSRAIRLAPERSILVEKRQKAAQRMVGSASSPQGERAA